MKPPYPVIDEHLHLYAWSDPATGETFLHGLEPYRRACGLRAINVAALACGHHDVGNNLLCAFYKLANPDTFAHGGIGYAAYPARPGTTPAAMDPLAQYRDLMDIGFDGIKLMECKPSYRKKTEIPICDDYYAPFFAAAERDGAHLLMHVNDPDEFWDPARAPDWAKANGWFYGDDTFVRDTEIYAEIDRLLNRHPRLNVTFAHFFFRSKQPEILETMFAKYPRMSVDLTPGSEMYDGFSARPAYYKDFFTRYADRVLFGTDGCFPCGEGSREWLCEKIYTFMSMDDGFVFDAWRKDTHGLGVPAEAVRKIFVDNFLALVGEKPRPINRLALKDYLAKYRSWIVDPALGANIDALAAELL